MTGAETRYLLAAMIQLAGRLVSLLAAVALTFVATAMLTNVNGVADAVWPMELYAGISPVVCADCDGSFGPPPPPLRLVHPSVRPLIAPQLICEMPGDPATVMDCDDARLNAVAAPAPSVTPEVGVPPPPLRGGG